MTDDIISRRASESNCEDNILLVFQNSKIPNLQQHSSFCCVPLDGLYFWSWLLGDLIFIKNNFCDLLPNLVLFIAE